VANKCTHLISVSYDFQPSIAAKSALENNVTFLFTFQLKETRKFLFLFLISLSKYLWLLMSFLCYVPKRSTPRSRRTLRTSRRHGSDTVVERVNCWSLRCWPAPACGRDKATPRFNPCRATLPHGRPARGPKTLRAPSSILL